MCRGSRHLHRRCSQNWNFSKTKQSTCDQNLKGAFRHTTYSITLMLLTFITMDIFLNYKNNWLHRTTAGTVGNQHWLINLMHKILIYLRIKHLLKSSTSFEHYPDHLQEVYVVTVYMQPLVSSSVKCEFSKITVLQFAELLTSENC
jgi:hypothetical protein